jgi:putative transposase
VKYHFSLRNDEDLLFERGIDLTYETVRFWWNRFGPIFAGEVRRKRVSCMRGFHQRRRRLYEMYVRIYGEMHDLWRQWIRKVKCWRASHEEPETR